VAAAYIEFFRNIPLLLQVFVWYSVVIVQTLPSPREAWTVFGYAYISNRGLMIPSLSGAPDKGALVWLLAAIALAWVAILIISRLVYADEGAKTKTGLRLSLLFLAIGALLVLVMGRPFELEAPTKTAFSFSGGITIIPELIALLFALSVYMATYIAEAVRAGVMAVNRGQVEAAAALGLGPLRTTKLIVVPQAMRIIIPPLSTTYLGLIKNSSLAVAIGYPDLVATGGTILNQTGKAIEIVTIWMVVYLSLSLATSLLMNWFNAKMALVER
jgi:general L-amino acid transport system permease protein